MAFSYRVDSAWPQFPGDGPYGEAVGVACDSRGRVFIFFRGPRPVQVFEPDGPFAAAWGEGLFVRPHGIFIGPDDTVYCTDDVRPHRPILHASRGSCCGRWARSGRPSDTGATSHDYRTIRRAGPPFCYPTQPRRRPDRRPVRLGRLRQRPDPSLRAGRPTAAIVGQAGQRTGPVPRAARHRRGPRRHRLRRRPRE